MKTQNKNTIPTERIRLKPTRYQFYLDEIEEAFELEEPKRRLACLADAIPDDPEISIAESNTLIGFIAKSHDVLREKFIHWLREL